MRFLGIFILILLCGCSGKVTNAKKAIVREVEMPGGIDQAIKGIDSNLKILVKKWPRRISSTQLLATTKLREEMQKLKDLQYPKEITQCDRLSEITLQPIHDPVFEEQNYPRPADVSARMENALEIAISLRNEMVVLMKKEVEIQRQKLENELNLYRADLIRKCQADTTARGIRQREQMDEQKSRIRLAGAQVKAAFPRAYRKVESGH